MQTFYRNRSRIDNIKDQINNKNKFIFIMMFFLHLLIKLRHNDDILIFYYVLIADTTAFRR